MRLKHLRNGGGARARVTVVALSVAALGACVQPDAPTGELVSVKTDVEFDKVPDKAAAAAAVPANFGDPLDDWANDTGTRRIPDLFFLTPGLGLPPPPGRGGNQPASDPSCPVAALSEWPDEETFFNVPDKSRLPREGLYRWRREGHVTANGTKTPLSGFEERIIRSVKLVSDQPRPGDAGQPMVPRLQYTFEVVQPEVMTSNYVVTTFFVDTDSPGQVAERPTVPYGPQVRVNNGPPERGLVIRKIARLDASGKEIGTPFAPPTGVLIAPLPVKLGEQYTGAAVDPVTGQAVTFTGQTTRRARVDACGDILEGWMFEGELAVTGTVEATRKMTFLISPNMGAIPLKEVIEGVTESGDVNLTFTIGQKDPTPLTVE